jgi:hypothetical protein
MRRAGTPSTTQTLVVRRPAALPPPNGTPAGRRLLGRVGNVGTSAIRLGVTRWSFRLLSNELGISHVWVPKIWRRWGPQPWRTGTFKFSTDPELEAIRDIVELYLHPPENAIVLCVDTKPQVQGMVRTAPTPPLRLRRPESEPTTSCPTAPPTTLRSVPGWRSTRGSSCSAPHLPGPGLTWSRSLARHPGRPSTAAASSA